MTFDPNTVSMPAVPSLPVDTTQQYVVQTPPAETTQQYAVETAPVDTTQQYAVQTSPVETAPVQTLPIETATAPVETAPVMTNINPVQPAPVETAPVQTPPAQTQPATAVMAPAVPKYVRYDEYQSSKLFATPNEQKTIPGTGPGTDKPAGYYHVIPNMYNYGTDENRILNDFLLEFPEVTSPRGIESKKNQSGRMEHSIMIRFDPGNAEHSRLIQVLTQLHRDEAQVLGGKKGAVGLRTFDPNNPVATGMKELVYYPYDKMTGELIEGRAPSMYIKMFTRGEGAMKEQTLFTAPPVDGEKPVVVPWELLYSAELTFVPLMLVKRIYIGGGKASIQMEMQSAIITGVRARNTASLQTATMERYAQSRPDLADAVSAQLAQLKMDRQDQLLMLPATDTSGKEDENNNQQEHSTFSGVTPTNTGAMQNYTQPAPNMQDFTAGAPTRQVQTYN